MDALLDVEEQMISAGYEDGVARGIEAGTSTGYHMGLGKGRELGAEIGQYHGQAEALMALLAVRRKQLTERQHKTLLAVRKLVAGMSYEPQDEAFFEALNELRAKARMIDAWLGKAPQKSDAAPMLSF